MEGQRLELDTKPLRVTFFEDRAEVVRATQATVPAGTVLLSLRGVTPLVDDQSVLPMLQGAAKLLSAQVTRRTHETSTGSESELRDSESDQKKALSRRVLAERTLEVAQDVYKRQPFSRTVRMYRLRSVFGGLSGRSAACLPPHQPSRAEARLSPVPRR